MLRADLQQFFSIDLDEAMSGRHSVNHIAALVAHMPQQARLVNSVNADMKWTLNDVLIASLLNNFRMFVWGMSDPKKRGAKPELIGPSYMTKQKRTLPARVLSINELMTELNKPRKVN